MKRFLSVLLAVMMVVQIAALDVFTAEAADMYSSTSWGLYYVGCNASSTVKKTQLYTYGGYYSAVCTSISGNCSSIIIDITAFSDYKYTVSVPLTTTVQFTRTATINFQIQKGKMPSDQYVYYKVNMTYKNGTSAYSNGTLSILT